MLPTELSAKCTVKGALPLVVLAVKMAAKTGEYVPIAEAVCPFETFAVRPDGMLQPLTLLKATVCDPTVIPETVVPLLCQLPPFNFHHAPSVPAASRLNVAVGGAGFFR